MTLDELYKRIKAEIEKPNCYPNMHVMIDGDKIRYAKWVDEEISPYEPVDFDRQIAHWEAKDVIADLTLEDLW